MSLFLGKIHYWLFNKIVWFENLEDEIVELARENGMDTEKLGVEIKEKYGQKLPNLPLEEMIDTSNIHGWLQNRITLAEGRMASWVTAILDNDEASIKDLEKIFVNQGIKAANEVKEEGNLNSAEDIYNAINDYILDGMPCDRVNEVIASSENEVTWKRTICVHTDAWNKVNGDVKVFYHLRGMWVATFVKEINSEFKYIEENDTMIIRK